MKRPKLVYLSKDLTPASDRLDATSNYAIYASYLVNAGGLFVGNLKVIRKTDGRRLFPFDGAPIIGPFETREKACEAAKTLANVIVCGDLVNPER